MMMPLVAHLHAIYSSAALPGHPGLRGVYVFTSIVTLEKNTSYSYSAHDNQLS